MKRTHSTNKAIILLKTKDRPNEQSQTKPILTTNLLKTKQNHYQQSHYVVENKGLDGQQSKPVQIHCAPGRTVNSVGIGGACGTGTPDFRINAPRRLTKLPATARLG
jgi:hypothetical protein